MSIIAIARTSNDPSVRYGGAFAGVRVVRVDGFHLTDDGLSEPDETELAAVEGPISIPDPGGVGWHDNWLDETAADELLARTGYEKAPGEGWRRSDRGWLATIEPTHAPGYDEYKHDPETTGEQQ